MKTEISPQLVNTVLVLGDGVELVPVMELAVSVRNKLVGREDDVVISRNGGRSNSRLMDAAAADFIGLFREPRRLVDAVIAFAGKIGGDPLEILEQVYPLVIQFRNSGFLVAQGGDSSLKIEPRYKPGTVIHGFKIIHCEQLLFDTEVYKAKAADGGEVALKCLRSDKTGRYLAAFKREQKVLLHLASDPRSPAPALIAADFNADPPYLATRWCANRKIMEVARRETLKRRAELTVSLLDAYAKLHESGWMHGDVHPKNLLLSKNDQVVLVDFGEATPFRSPGFGGRSGVLPFHEPELALAFLQRRPAPVASPRGEQYSVAALSYQILTSKPCIELALDRATALRQIAETPPRTFEEVGAKPWPALEAVLLKALSKSPASRYPTMRRFADAFRKATLQRVIESRQPLRTGKELDSRIDSFLGQYGLSSNVLDFSLPTSPSASVFYGAAGVAYSLLRIGQLRSDPLAAAAANIWIRRTRKDIESNPGALENPKLSVTAAQTGRVALFHRATGIHATEALICHALGDHRGMEAAILRFLDAMPDHLIEQAAGNPKLTLDATQGPPSLLFGLALLLPLCLSASKKTNTALRSSGDSLYKSVLEFLGSAPVAGALPPADYYGMAHGWAGVLFALLRWSESTGQRPPDLVRDHLDAFAARAIPMATGLAWPIRGSKPFAPPWPGWCNGSAGYVFLWSLAARRYSESRFADLAQQSGEHCWSYNTYHNGSLCCGLAGMALAMFELEGLAPGQDWRKRAETLVRQALLAKANQQEPHSLFKGGVGSSLAAAEILYSQAANFPFCQPQT